jgi:hypothetical protein
MSNPETKNCQNCKNPFTIELDDFAFYEKMKVPPPTFCPECVYKRQISFRNARNLYRRKDDKTGKEIIALYSPDKNLKVYDQKIWNGDDWDPMDYGRDYDFSRPFFTQLKELMQDVPWPALTNLDAVNSDYCNFSKGNKDCYLIFGGDFNENAEYSTFNFHTKNSSDLFWVNKGELCYELIDSENNYKGTHGRYLVNCLDSHFGFELNGCQNCIGCINLRNQKYCILNERFSPEDYKKAITELDLGSYSKQQLFKARFEDLKQKSIYRSYRILNSVNSTGDNIYNSKNCRNSFDVFDGAEDCKHLYLAAGGVKDSWNCSHIGLQSELCYNSMSVYPASRSIGSWAIFDCLDVEHSMMSRGCRNIFGCVGLKNKEYCILNKQYPKEEYLSLKVKIIEQMLKMPYRNSVGQVHTYGDFFPADLSLFGYNESVAYEQFPIIQGEAEQQGYFWHYAQRKEHEITLEPAKLPDHIKEVTDAILKETIGCEHQAQCNEGCTLAFKLIPSELNLYRQLNMPVPRFCPNCRNAQRMAKRNPLKLWHRKCTCAGSKSANEVYQNQARHSHREDACPNEFETSYAPDRPEIIYCEQCYQQEVV